MGSKARLRILIPIRIQTTWVKFLPSHFNSMENILMFDVVRLYNTPYFIHANFCILFAL